MREFKVGQLITIPSHLDEDMLEDEVGWDYDMGKCLGVELVIDEVVDDCIVTAKLPEKGILRRWYWPKSIFEEKTEFDAKWKELAAHLKAFTYSDGEKLSGRGIAKMIDKSPSTVRDFLRKVKD